MFKFLAKGVKSVAAGKTQADLGLQSPHLPSAIDRIGRFLYGITGAWIGVTWYTAYANTKTAPGSGPSLALPGMSTKGGSSRPDPVTQGKPAFAANIGKGGGASGGSSSAGNGTVTPKAAAVNYPPSRKGGGFLPIGAVYKPGRSDQGRDGSTNPGGPIIAPGNGVVVHILSDPGGFGPDYPVVKFTSGPYTGRMIYIGHTHAQIAAGQTFKAGATLSLTGTNGVGNATVPGWFEIGFADGGYPGRFGQPTPF
jgi:hypothetical protein